MAVFSENLTSKILQKESLRILNTLDKECKVLEIGCGDGNITRFMEIHQIKRNQFHCSDISHEAIEKLQEELGAKDIKAKQGDFFNPWISERPFGLIISDVSSISQPIADKSPWYNDIVSNCGDDGLKNIDIILDDLPNYLSSDGYFILPIISLCNVNKLYTNLKKRFRKIEYTKKVFWPMPAFYKDNLEYFKKKNLDEIIQIEYKFGSYNAFTCAAICSNI